MQNSAIAKSNSRGKSCKSKVMEGNASERCETYPLVLLVLLLQHVLLHDVLLLQHHVLVLVLVLVLQGCLLRCVVWRTRTRMHPASPSNPLRSNSKSTSARMQATSARLPSICTSH